ncbi:MAG TPA: alpha/beta fold hydrolase, partial [Solimonas sp.]|nr:alpha/beta fold hydrolase [Solimonas sp.]
MSDWQPGASDQSSRWISRELSGLLEDASRCHLQPAAEPAFDVLIVGSGYGGAIAAAELAGSRDASGRKISVGLLERGREFLPGSFPAGMAELPTQLRGSLGGRRRGGEGLFDLRIGTDVSVVLANGLGGGSLINAGVMEVPADDVFDTRWPQALRDVVARKHWYGRAKELLGARVGGAANGISRHPELQGKTLPKTAVLKSMAPRHYREAAITVAMEGHVTSGGVKLNPCKLCGDCATGCNHGAKESLDTNLLVRAFRQGAQLYCGATVLRLQPAPGGTGWSVMVAYTDEKLRRQDGVPRWITARRVILAAGTMGSTEILLRSRLATSQLSLSPQLGQRFSGNGDMISFGYDYGEQARANAVADEDQPPSERGVGPTITGILDQELETGRGPARHIVIEEMAVPGALRRAAEESIATAVTLQALGEFDCKSHGAGRPDDDPYAVHRAKIRDMSIFAAIGDDGAAGSLQLATAADDGACDGQLEVVWPGANRLPLYDAQVRRIDQLARGAGFRGRTLANPLWRYLPDAMASLVGDQRGPVVTVHPLGGCAMGDSSVEGVVDDCGRVFNATAAAGEERCHEGLMVLDGAIIPSALATNPALTIAALSLRAVTSLRESWGWQAADAPLAPLGPRPQLADVEAQVRTRAAQPPQHTMVGVSERLSGPMSLRDTDGRLRDCWVELTLTYDPLQLSHLFRPKGDGRLEDAQLSIGTRPGSRGRLRIFRREEWEHLRQQSLSVAERRREEAKASRSFELRGSLTVLERERTSVLGRTLRGLGAWLLNRGLRDVFQGVVEALRQSLRGEKRSGPGAWELLLGVLRLASRAGEVRLFRYKLDIGAEILFAGPAVREGGQPIRHFDMPPLRQEPQLRGLKRITYGRPSNPWRQLQELELDWLDGPLARRSPRRLTLEPHYFAARGQPLLRIESQRDHVEALADFASLGAYFLRMLLSIHVWNMRKPDLPRPRQIERLPGAVPGLPDPEIHWLAVDVLGGEAVRMRLACYRSAAAPGTGGTGRPPVLLIHGYSASGTTYAHPALKPGLAPYLARAGHEVWIVDMRSSAGLPTAAHPWTFEQVALADIPAAVDFICKHGGHAQVDVVAHCMGAVMFSMAVLSADLPAGEIGKLLRPRDAADGVDGIDRFREQRAALPRRIRRAVLSQNGPVMVMSPQNIFRGYVMSYFGQLFGSLTYRFRPEPDEGRGADLLDRFLGSLPYPDDELLLENPWQPCRRTEHLAARHRMDALYGRTFTLENFDSDVLDRIDDFFGPLNLDTVAQVIHLAQHQTITSRGGRNRFVSRQSLQRLWTFKTLALHSEHNGLADIATLYRIEAVLKNAGCHVEKKVLRGAGHQDSLIGKTSLQTFGHIADFLGAPPEHQRFGVEPARQAFIADAPWLGPMLGRQDDGSVMLGLGASPQLGRPAAVALLPVERDGQGRWDCERLLQLLQLDPE